MIVAILICVSVIAVGQLGLFYWRASIANNASRQVSDRVRAAAGIKAGSVSSGDFRAILRVFDLTPDLGGAGRTYREIRVYYLIVEKIGRLIPPVASLAEAEMAMCSRFVAALLDERLERNTDSASQMRGM